MSTKSAETNQDADPHAVVIGELDHRDEPERNPGRDVYKYASSFVDELGIAHDASVKGIIDAMPHCGRMAGCDTPPIQTAIMLGVLGYYAGYCGSAIDGGVKKEELKTISSAWRIASDLLTQLQTPNQEHSNLHSLLCKIKPPKSGQDVF